MSPQLTRITMLEELRALQALYSRDWPQHCLGYYCLDNFIRWLSRDADIKNVQIFTLNDDWRRDGLFLIVDRYQLFVHSLCTGDNSLLTQALSLLNWSGGYKVSTLLARHREAVDNVLRQKQLALEYDCVTHLYYMPQADALKLAINCPAGYYLQQLSVADAELVNELWPNRHRGSLYFVQRQIALNANVGVYVEGTHELVAWCLRLQAGVLGALQVKDTHKRLGLGSLVTRAIAKQLAELGHDVMASVNPTNLPSCGMFEKLGFQVTDSAYWLRTEPTRPEWLWPENEQDVLQIFGRLSS